MELISTITPLPPAPDWNHQAPAEAEESAQAFTSALPLLVEEINEATAEINGRESTVIATANQALTKANQAICATSKLPTLTTADANKLLMVNSGGTGYITGSISITTAQLPIGVGLTVNAAKIALGTPGSITTASANSASGTTHSHALDLTMRNGTVVKKHVVGNWYLNTLCASSNINNPAQISTVAGCSTFCATSANGCCGCYQLTCNGVVLCGFRASTAAFAIANTRITANGDLIQFGWVSCGCGATSGASFCLRQFTDAQSAQLG